MAKTAEMLNCQVFFVFSHMTIHTWVEVADTGDYRDHAIKEAETQIKDHYGLDFDALGLQEVEVEAQS